MVTQKFINCHTFVDIALKQSSYDIFAGLAQPPQVAHRLKVESLMMKSLFILLFIHTVEWDLTA